MSKAPANAPANSPKEVEADIPTAAPVEEEDVAAVAVVEVIPEAVEAAVELLPLARVVWPKSIPNCSHQRPTVLKSAVVFPMSRLTVISVGVVVAVVICMLEMRNPSFNVLVVLPHQ